MPRIAIVAALEREVKPLIRDWPSREADHEGHKFRFFEKDDVVVVCGGIGAQAARRATEAAIALYKPAAVYSVGFAGALDEELEIGAIVFPRRVVDAQDGSSVDTGVGENVLVSFSAVADPEQKDRLAAAYEATAIDMEAAAVARGAGARGVRFAAVKAISDKRDFEMPPMDRFVGADGRFHAVHFAGFVLLRPWWWWDIAQLARNSKRAADELCRALKGLDHDALGELEFSGGRFSTR